MLVAWDELHGRRQTKACIILKWCFSLFVLSQCVTCSPACTLCCQKWQTVGNSIIFCLSCNGRVKQNLYFEEKRINYFAPVCLNYLRSGGRPSLFVLEAGGKDKTKNECPIKRRTPDDRDNELSAWFVHYFETTSSAVDHWMKLYLTIRLSKYI